MVLVLVVALTLLTRLLALVFYLAATGGLIALFYATAGIPIALVNGRDITLAELSPPALSITN